MKKIKSKLELKKLSRQQKRKLVRDSKQLINSNARYTTVAKGKINDADASMVIIDGKEATIVNYESALKTLYAEVNEEEKNFDNLMDKVGGYFDDNNNGDVTFFTDAKIPYYFPGDASDITTLDPPEGFMVSYGDHPGTIDFMCHTVKGGKLYIIEVSLTPEIEESWGGRQNFLKSSGTLEKLTSGDHIFLRIMVQGSNAKSDWSNQICDIRVP